MRRLIIANTYYQLIFAIQLRRTKFQNDKIVLLLTDNSKNSANILTNVSVLSIFDESIYVETPGSRDCRSMIDKIVDFFQISFADSNRYEFYIKDIDDLYFDEVLMFNFNIRMYGLHSLLSKYNKDIMISIFEEGILSYNAFVISTYRRRIINFFRKIQGKASVDDALKNFYCFYPELYHGGLKAIKVNSITKDDITVHDIKNVFKIDKVSSDYPEKYIFFTSVYDFEGGDPIGEYDIACKIADLVGKDNLLIKVHPRDTRGVYEKNGFKVDKNSSIPWEAIQLSGDFSDKIFITATSGSVLAGSFMSEKPTRTYYMFKCCDISNNKTAQITAKSIMDLLNDCEMKKLLTNVSIAESVEDTMK